MSSADKLIRSVFYGAYGVDPSDIPCCPICDSPMQRGEGIELQLCDAGPGNPDLLRIVHYECANPEEDDEDDE